MLKHPNKQTNKQKQSTRQVSVCKKTLYFQVFDGLHHYSLMPMNKPYHLILQIRPTLYIYSHAIKVEKNITQLIN